MDFTAPEARARLVEWIALLDADADTIRAAAAAIASMPQPPEEPAKGTARAEQIRDTLEVTSASDQLAAVLRAREWLEQLAAESD